MQHGVVNGVSRTSRDPAPVRAEDRTVRPLRALVLRLASENPNWGQRRPYGEPLVPAVKVAASTVRKILKEAGSPSAPREGVESGMLVVPGIELATYVLLLVHAWALEHWYLERILALETYVQRRLAPGPMGLIESRHRREHAALVSPA